MKTYVKKLTFGLVVMGLLSACATTGQIAQTEEYDDLYFTSEDRNTVEFTKINDPEKAEYQRGSYVFDQQSFSSKNVNPEYISRYNNAGNQQSLPQEDNALNDEYYVEEFEREDLREADQPQVVNNFYGAGPYSNFSNPAFNRWGGFYDPFFGPTAFAGSGYGFGPGFGFRSGFNVGIGFGFGLNRPFGFGNSLAFHPWRDPFFRPFGFRNAYALGFYNGYYGGRFLNRPNVVVINNNEYLGVNRRRRVTNGRNVQRVTRATADRNDAVVIRGRTTADRNVVTSRTRGIQAANARSRSRDTRDFTSSQNEYYQRSRARTGSASNSRAYKSTTPASRNSRSYSSTDAARSSRNGSYTRSRSTSPSRSYSRGSYGSRSRSGSYSRGSSRSRSSGSYNRGSYGGSRSSGSYSRGSSSGSRGGSRGSRGGGN
jgi:hypothetical protein